MDINVGRDRKKFRESLLALLKELPKCQHEDRSGMDSFDVARGDHLCNGVATVTRIVVFGPPFPPETRRFCEHHKRPGDVDLPHALAYRKLMNAAIKKLKEIT